MPQIAKVAVAAATYAIDKPYDYVCPDEACSGQRVLVPFGRGNRISEGMILSVRREIPAAPLKAIRELLDEESVASDREIKLALWMRQRYFCTFYDAIRTILPAAVWYKYRELWQPVDTENRDELSQRERELLSLLEEKPLETGRLKERFGEAITAVLWRMKKQGYLRCETQADRRIHDKTVTYASLALTPNDALQRLRESGRRAPRQMDALQMLIRTGETPVHDLCYFTGVSRQALQSMEKRGLITLREQEDYRLSPVVAQDPVPISLNREQQQVFETILSQALSGEAGVTALEGVTGSGKTLIYIRLAQELLQRGKTAMILVPEIALTPQMMARFSAYFGNDVALLHSALRMTERYDQYKRIRRGEARIVLGTRSAVFAPLSNIGLIVLDEEQESSYESENAPSYHARDVAKYRCAQEHARLVLGSATPTVETAYYAREGVYHLSRLRKRYNEKHLPRVILADMRQELREGYTGTISRALREELERNIRAGEQSILFINRRGNSRQLLCPSCGYVPQCPRCSVYLTYHSANERMMCHYCGHSIKAPDVCPDCGGALKHIGTGTQRIEAELHELFPQIEIIRMDADTVGEGHEKLLHRFTKERIPILLGTQMVAKGLDFENVTLVGVLAADLSLYVDHYRASERTFSLLTQVVGRAGRGEKSGRAVIQTLTPENDVIQAAADQDFERFYRREIRMRRLRQEPPFADQFVITVAGREESQVRRGCAQLKDSLRTAVDTAPYDALGIEILGPAPAPVVKINDRFRYRITLIGRNEKGLRDLISAYMKAFSQRRENKGLSIFTDCNRMD